MLSLAGGIAANSRAPVDDLRLDSAANADRVLSNRRLRLLRDCRDLSFASRGLRLHGMLLLRILPLQAAGGPRCDAFRQRTDPPVA